MIDASMSNEIKTYNARAEDALGYNVPGYQPHFHDVLERQTRSVKVFDSLSVAAPEDTYFVVDNGDGSHSYTRSGNFRVSQGKLMTSDGRTVLGYPNGVEKGTLTPMTVPAGIPDGTVSIASDGTLSYGGPAQALGAMPAAIGPHAAPVTDMALSENLPAPAPSTIAAAAASTAPTTAAVSAHAGAKGLDVPDIALGDDLRNEPVTLPEVAVQSTTPQIASQVTLPDTAGRLDPRAVLGQPADAQRSLTSLNQHNEPQVQDSAVTGAPSRGTDASMAASMIQGIKTVGYNGAGIGTPLGKIAMARFASGTTVSNDGRSTSGPPLEMGPPGNGTIEHLKTGARDVGNVDAMASRVAVGVQNTILNAMLQVETARQSNAKKAMDLIK